MHRAFRAALALVLLALTGLSAEAQGFPSNTFPGLPRPGPGPAPLRPMLGHPPPSLHLAPLPGLSHPTIARPFGRKFDHGAGRVHRSHPFPQRIGEKPGFRRHLWRGPHRHLHSGHRGFRAHVRLSDGVRVQVDAFPNRPFRRSLRHRAPSHQSLACSGGICTIEFDRTDLTETGALVCVVTTRTGRCAKVVRLPRP